MFEVEVDEDKLLSELIHLLQSELFIILLGSIFYIVHISTYT